MLNITCDKCKKATPAVQPYATSNQDVAWAKEKGWRKLQFSNLTLHICPNCLEEFYKWIGFRINAISQKEKLK